MRGLIERSLTSTFFSVSVRATATLVLLLILDETDVMRGTDIPIEEFAVASILTSLPILEGIDRIELKTLISVSGR